ncbi:ankyrin repeat protein, putative [Trichomonas vaginalis G3]|uniref:Ankyrin repeat protein, putative n=1 Tax=Trichomonas vaginalis (strain ATCC PRA-98 / G3) TaxID=412133 RepID=A2DP06_TRIV3|nr:ankyrin repeat and SOCS box-containing protein 4 family [Trichomonas vaginalis G3]EAY17855.1 ankyrin repeat protein, putative [Trichomonas vaginalis G3]KAI5489945.1 ankyrin repeat and SOCS box-containing protein 4 family [Trichomonas vaginalis G3]|eukprot:XP_001329990.1 ankyrin repeat protein [Trichomonas vaginalis G3]
MEDHDSHHVKYNELKSIYKYYIDSFNALYQLKTGEEEELNSIYKFIKAQLIDSKNCLPVNIARDILHIIPYNNRYTKSYLKLVKFIIDDYHVKKVTKISTISGYLFYKEYGICLDISDEFYKLVNFNIHEEDTIYKALMYNDIERLIYFTEIEGFNKNQTLKSSLFPDYNEHSLLELCCYHGAVDCFKLLRSKFNSEITQTCLELSFLGKNPEIMSECLKYQKPDKECMRYAIISHNIDFVSFLMNEYKIEIDLEYCAIYNNLDAFFVYFDQTNDVNKCFNSSPMFEILALCEYFFSQGADINAENSYGETALHMAIRQENKEIFEFLISHGADVNKKDRLLGTPLNVAAYAGNIEIIKALISHGADINGKAKIIGTALHIATVANNKEVVEYLLLHGANINAKNTEGLTALYSAICHNKKELVELLLSYGANINEKNILGETLLHSLARTNSKEIIELLLSYGAKIDEVDDFGKTVLYYAEEDDNEEIVELLLSHGADINKKHILVENDHDIDLDQLLDLICEEEF